MSTRVETWTWPQGEDLVIELAYKEGPDPRRATLLRLGTGYQARMDIVDFTGAVLAELTSSEEEIILGNATPNLTVVLSRSLTLPGGPVGQHITNGNSPLEYDIFLRNTTTNRQVKILKGTINCEESSTLWA